MTEQEYSLSKNGSEAMVNLSVNFATVWLAAILTWAIYFLASSTVALVSSTFLSSLDVRIMTVIAGVILTAAAAKILNWASDREFTKMVLFVLVFFPVLCYLFAISKHNISLWLDDELIRLDPPLFPPTEILMSGTWIALWGCLYFVMTFIAGLNKARERALKADALAHEAQLKMLRYQLNPHFLFNTLNGISTLVLEKETQRANKVLVNLSQFLRHTLDSAPEQTVSLESELKTMRLYLDLEKTRFAERLTIREQISTDTINCQIPSLILQPIIENSIKHAVAPSENGGEIDIRSQLDDNYLVLEVRDTGPGIKNLSTSETRRPGVGLTNTRLRLKETYGDRASVKFENHDPSGMSVFIRIPVEGSDV